MKLFGAVSVLAMVASSWMPVAEPQAPAPAADTGVIAGALTSADLGRPVRRAEVRLTSASPRATWTTATDGNGRFTFRGLPAGEYTLFATRPGYLEMVYGAQRTGAGVPGTPVSLAAGQRIDDIAFRLPRGGVIAGIVTDEYGDPAFNVPVRAMRFGYQNGQRTARPVGNAMTDDLGAYRIAGLPPGDYAVSAVPRDSVASAAATADSAALAMARRAEEAKAAGRPLAPPPSRDAATRRADDAPDPRTGYVATYFPGVPSPAGLSVVRVDLGQQVHAVDLQLQVLRTSTVSGVVTTPDGAPTMASIQLIDPAMPIANLGVWFRHATGNGRFSFAGLPPGSYVLRAQATKELGAAGGAGLTADMPVTVGEAGDQELSVRLQPGVTIAGTVRLDTLAGADASKLLVQLVPLAGPSDWEMPVFEAPVDAEGQFSVTNVPNGRFQVRPRGLPETWAIDSAVFDGREAADVHLDVRGRAIPDGTITFTSSRATLSGSLTDTDGRPVVNRSVLLFPEDRELWVGASRRIHVAQPAADGQFTIRNLPPGAFRLAAVTPPEQGEQFDPEFLRRAAGSSVPVTLAAGQESRQGMTVR
jgi:hypothetical protein